MRHPGEGFYEWSKAKRGAKKSPHYFRRKDGGLLPLAGLWEAWHAGVGEVLETCCIITTLPNSVVSPVHDRMPAVLREGEHERWLDPKADPADLYHFLRHLPAQEIEGYAVGPAVNNPQNEGPACVEPAGGND